MKLREGTILFVLAMASATVVVQAQDGAASAPGVARCTDWMNATVPAGMKVDAAAFCAGAKQQQVPNLGEWHSVGRCGPSEKPSADGKEPFCASSGIMFHGWAIASGFSSASGDGGDLMPENGDSAGAQAAFYTLTPVQIEQLHLAAGLYRFRLSHPADGWKMAVASETGKEIGTASLRADQELHYFGTGLSIALHYSGFRCKDPVNVHELIITYGGNELYGCMRPSPAATSEDAAAKQ